MTNKYNETEKIWHGPSVEHNYPNIGIGHLVLEKFKETDPERVLEVEHESGASLTAGQIRTQTITAAQNLMRLGVKKGDIVIVYSRSNIKITPITFALYTIGATVNFFYLDLKGEDIEYYFELMDPTAIFYEEEFKTDTFQALKNLKLSNLKHILSLNSETESVDEILFKPIDNIENFQPPDIGDPNELAALLTFTSGSTGRPKISVHSHSMMLLGLHKKWWHMEPKSVVCVLSDLRWISQIELMLQPVFYDVIRIYTSKCEKDFDDSYEYELFYSNKVTHYCTVSILLLKTLQDIDKTNQISKLSYLRVILLGGEVVTKSLLDYAAEIIPHCKIINSYGMTELYGIISSDEKVFGKIVNRGILANGYELKVIDEHGNHLGPNEKGRLCLRSKVPLIGYFKNDKANREHLKGDGWYTTEEYGYMDSDHLLNVVIRYKYLLRYYGQVIVPTEIENIVNSHPNVLISALVGYPDPENIDSEIGTIFVVPKNYSQSDGIEDELLVLLRKNLTKDQTKLVRFLKVVEKAPMVNACKVDRVALKETAAIESANYLMI
ncbi:putative acyl--CoA ligase YdaB [Episyrphus balteatus]|uniref:putative acyl--CoA ligase YdaB n=1 Tax=Episyrphus balteatus TaxID=286459 RepID=UPI0024866C89|nr:putative acyl--CoA ligase YdaB [Episyrphus balteatus]